MKNQSRMLKGIATVIIGVGLLSGSANAKMIKIGVKDDVAVKKEIAADNGVNPNIDLDEIEFLEILNSVPLDEKSAQLIRKFQEKEGRNRLHAREFNDKNGCTVETFRNKEVLLITIPADKLFSPNSTELRPTADALLNPLRRYLKEPDMYRVLMVMHTDNTGSDAYRDMLTEKRSQAVADWFENHGSDTEFLFPFAYGDDSPLVKNNSMTNRAKNRRLEVYLVPGKKMLDQAKKGRIVF